MEPLLDPKLYSLSLQRALLTALPLPATDNINMAGIKNGLPKPIVLNNPSVSNTGFKINKKIAYTVIGLAIVGAGYFLHKKFIQSKQKMQSPLVEPANPLINQLKIELPENKNAVKSPEYFYT